MPSYDVNKDSNIKALAQNIAYLLFRGIIEAEWIQRMEPLLKDIRERVGWKEPIEAYFEKLRGIITKDQDMIELDALRTKTLALLNTVRESMLRDLESQFSVFRFSRPKVTGR